jgi:hypothetical protein
MNETIPQYLLDALKAGGAISVIIVGLGWYFYREIKAANKSTLDIVQQHKLDYKTIIEEMIKAINDLTNAVKERK